MKCKNFLIRFMDLLLILALLAGYQGIIYSREKKAEIAELESKINQLEGEKQDILQLAENYGMTETSESENVAGGYLDGTYDGTGQGFGGEIRVEVGVTDGKIASVEVTEAKGEDQAYLSMAEAIIDTIVEKQTAEVDGISGATYSSNGIKDAVKEALKEAVTQ